MEPRSELIRDRRVNSTPLSRRDPRGDEPQVRIFDSFRPDTSGPASGRGSVPAVPLGEPTGAATSGRRSVLVLMAGTIVPYPVAGFGGIGIPFREPHVHLLGPGPPPGLTRRSEPHPARKL